jgi:hypothetical protein
VVGCRRFDDRRPTTDDRFSARLSIQIAKWIGRLIG